MGQNKPQYITAASMAADVNGPWQNVRGQSLVNFQAVWGPAAARSVAHDADDAVVAGTGTWRFDNGAFTAADVGGTITVAGATNPGNNGTFTILTVPDGTHVTTAVTGLTNETFGSGVTLVVASGVSTAVGSFIVYVTLDGTDLASGGYVPNGRLGPSPKTLDTAYTARFPGGVGDVGNLMIELPNLGAMGVMLHYEATSGTGSLEVGFSAKEVS